MASDADEDRATRPVDRRGHVDRDAAEWGRLRITLASIGDGVVSTDADVRVTYLNAVAETLTGWPLAEAAGRPLPEVFVIVHERTRRPVENPAVRALRERRAVLLSNHTVLIARDGTERPIDDSAAPMFDGAAAPVGAVLVFRDVTERRRAEIARSRLAAIVESSDDAIVTKTLDGVIRTWNAGAERIFGYTAAEAVGRPITLIIPPDRQGEETDILARLRRGERVDHFETVRVAKDGRRLDISLTVSPLRDAEGQVVGASKIARDITEKKRLERELRRRADELAEADRKKDDFIAILAHELRNPLAPLRNGLELMRLATDAGTVAGKARAMMDRQLNHMVRLIDDLLDVSRISRGKLYLQKSRVSLAEAVAHAVEAIGPAIASARHELTVTLPPEPVYLDADLTRLAQVFGNLLSNSAKYTEPGGRVWLTADVTDGEVVVSVRDTGIGIPADALPHVFDMFAQVDRSAERESGGLGIGLALVKGLVEMHGGTVTAGSPGPGAGSTFTVRLPRLKDEGGGVKDEVASSFTPPPSSFRRRVLVVDDNRDGAESMAAMLGLLGYEVHEAHDGLEAVELAERVRPDAILMDVGMPRLDGLEATRRIRDLPWGKAAAIVALTGWGQEVDRERSKAAGCDAHLLKPVELAELERLLSELVKR